MQHTIPSPFPDSSLCGCRGPQPRRAANALWLSRHLLLQHVEEPEAKPMQPTQLLVTTASKASATRRSQNAPQPQRPDLKENTGKACVCGCQSVWAAPNSQLRLHILHERAGCLSRWVRQSKPFSGCVGGRTVLASSCTPSRTSAGERACPEGLWLCSGTDVTCRSAVLTTTVQMSVS